MDNYKFHFHEDTFDKSDKNPPSLQEEDVEQQQQHFPHDYQNHNETVNISRPPLRQQHSLHSHHHHPHHPNHHHTVWKGRQNTYRETFIKTIYLTCATIITTCFIIECILIHLVILPCQHESGFLPTECTYVKTELVASSVKCENKCSKDRSTFQCIRVLVTYSRLNENFTASLFDNIATYQYYHSLGCATSSCHRQNSANHEWVEHFCQLIKKAARFPCYVHEDHIKEALLHKFYGPSTMFNTLFWPLFLLCLSSLCLLITWSFDRCHVWHDEKTIIA
uniref:Calcium-activated potassium channel subunit beta-2 n=1 Tax=Trichobilharzia regenti TaxID=157069 RepID=A0AA85JRC7_TRIRE|nr:unnamed protein product [Trichobilharzia regenti]